MIVFTPVAIALSVLVAPAETRRVTSPRWVSGPEARAVPEAWVAYPKSVVVVDSQRCARARFETASSLFSLFVCGA